MSNSGSESTPSPQKEGSKESCSWILERLIIESGRQIDRPRVRRAVQEADEAHDGLKHENWWLVLSEAAESLGFKSKVIDATSSQAVQMALDGDHVCWKTNAEDFSWRAVSKSERSKLQVLHPFSKSPAHWLNKGQLKRLIKESQIDSSVRCVVLQPYEALGIEMGHDTTPFQRLKNLLRPEWSDIWVVLVFALVAGLLSLATPIAVESLVNTVAFGTLMQPVFILAIILFAFLGMQAMMRGLQTFIVEIIQRRMFARISADLAFRLPRTKTEVEALLEYFRTRALYRAILAEDHQSRAGQ
jgi:ABC-type bacteriocin/lantibiotic exporter with double-glycine peptidase domain